MTRLVPLLAVLALTACALNPGAVSDIAMPTVAVRADPDATAATVAAALRESGARAAFVSASREAGWFEEVADGAGLTLSGPADLAGLGLAFLAPEPVGDTTLTLEYDGGSLTLHDALYEIEEDRLLDLIGFRVVEGTDTHAAIRSLLEYIATDVNNAAALVMAVAVPGAAAGDSVARMLSPAYYDAIRCEVGRAASPERAGIRLFYGPEARMYCEDAATEARSLGDWVRAELVMGRR